MTVSKCMAESARRARDLRYADTMARLTPLASGLGIVIELLTLIALRHSPRALAVSAISFVSMAVFNIWLLRALAKWSTRRTDAIRVGVSAIVSAATNHFTGWPLPTWLWLPYQSAAFDGDRGWNWWMVSVSLVTTDVVALHDGVGWTQPAIFSFVAIVTRLFTDARVAIVREMVDRSEAQRAELERTQAALRQAHKLEAVGRLAAGVAHEINTPVQFVTDSVHFVAEATGDLVRLLAAYRAGVPREQLADLEREMDLEFLVSETPKAIELTKDGLERIATIVRSMRQIAHPERTRMEPTRVAQMIETAVTLAMSECRDVADVVTELDDVPPVTCHAGEIVQVLVNLLANAACAIRETRRRGKITVRARRRGDEVILDVVDTGPGVPVAVRDRVFEPFFTTKPIGEGTGQGLALARGIVTRHGGTLTFETSASGTTFEIALPSPARRSSSRASAPLLLPAPPNLPH